MQIILVKAATDDAEEILEMQKAAFAPLLEKYKDLRTNPAAESLETVEDRLKSADTDTYFIVLGRTKIGVVRVKVQNDICNLKQILILPEYQ